MVNRGIKTKTEMPSPVDDKQPTLRRALGVFDGVALLIGITIGAGIYSTPQIIAGYLDSFGIIFMLWAAVSIFVFISGLVYAELGTRLPDTGGEYVYISRCFGPFAGFMFGWSQLFISGQALLPVWPSSRPTTSAILLDFNLGRRRVWLWP